MIEIPESGNIARMANRILCGKVVADVINATSPHRFAWYEGDPLLYAAVLGGRKVESVRGYGSYVDICLDDETHLAFSDGTNVRYYEKAERCPEKFQLLVVFDDDSFIVFTVAMYGGIYAFRGGIDNIYYNGSVEKLSPMDDRFDIDYLDAMIRNVGKDISVKALLATEQRIPGLGNGVLQDILFNAGLNPRCKISSLTGVDRQNLLVAIKDTLKDMIAKGGRDTEKDILGNPGGYHCLLSNKTCKDPCPRCGGKILKEAYLGGSVYYCGECQKR